MLLLQCIHSAADRHLSDFQFLDIINNVSINIGAQVLCECMHLILLGIYLQRQLLGHFQALLNSKIYFSTLHRKIFPWQTEYIVIHQEPQKSKKEMKTGTHTRKSALYLARCR